MQPTAIPRPATPQTETDRELKAYIYQQLVELQPYLLADSQMAVTVQQVASENGGTAAERDPRGEPPPAGDYLVQLTMTVEDGKLTAEGQGESVYEAFGEAKNVMVNQLSQLQNAVIDQADRDQEIESYLDGSRTIH